jgi:hypothetical protein
MSTTRDQLAAYQQLRRAGAGAVRRRPGGHSAGVSRGAKQRAPVRRRTALGHAPLLSRGLRGNQDGVAVGRWHTAAVAYCRLRAPAADQRLKKKSAHTDTGAKPEG